MGVGAECVGVCHHINRAECLLEPILYSLAPATRGGLHYRSESFQPPSLVDLKTRFPAPPLPPSLPLLPIHSEKRLGAVINPESSDPDIVSSGGKGRGRGERSITAGQTVFPFSAWPSIFYYHCYRYERPSDLGTVHCRPESPEPRVDLRTSLSRLRERRPRYCLPGKSLVAD